MADAPQQGKPWLAPDSDFERLVFAVFTMGGTTRVLFEDGSHFDFPLTPSQEEAAQSAELASARALALVRVDQRLGQAMADGATTPSGRAKTDVGSRELIMAAFALAHVSITFNATNFAQAFIFVDDDGTERSVTLDAAGTLGVGMAVAAHINTLRGYAKELTAQVNAAVSVAEIAAIDIDAGWPR